MRGGEFDIGRYRALVEKARAGDAAGGSRRRRHDGGLDRRRFTGGAGYRGDGGAREVCTAANDNAPGQVVISGHVAAVDRAIAIAAERGFKRSVKLPVSAPFHCSLMQPAADVMQKALAELRFKAPCGAVRRQCDGRGGE